MKNFIEVGKTEEEQVEQAKQWLSENLMYIIIGITLGVGGLASWNGYQTYQNTQAKNARTLYLSMNKDSDIAKQTNTLSQLKQDYSDSIYLAQAQLLLAKNAITNNDTNLAIEQLSTLTGHKNSIIAALASVYLAEAYIAGNMFNQAIAILTQDSTSLESLKSNEAFSVIKQDLLGDVYYLQKKPKLAKEQYQLAKKTADANNHPLAEILDVKINNL